MKALSIVVASYNRADLLDRALATYAHQTLPRHLWEYLLADDSSTDHTLDVVRKWQGEGLPIRLFDAATDLCRPKQPGAWRDGCGLRNALSTFAVGTHLVSTHPEILLPGDALESMLAALESTPARSWVTAIPYWLPPVPEGFWDGWGGSWAEVKALSGVEGFYSPDWPTPLTAPGAVDYRNQNQEQRTDWQSEVFWGMRMALWREMRGFREFTVWGSVDPDFWGRRVYMGISTFLAKSEQGPHKQKALMVYHPHHDSPRVMEETNRAIDEANAVRMYRSAVDVIETGGLWREYHHGPRERALVPGTTEGIMDDHLSRYRWAAQFVDKQPVLDAPCGTGYGLNVLLDSPSCLLGYVGVDIDAETVQAASASGDSFFATFMVGDMEHLKLPAASFGVVCCFEGLEHVTSQALALEEFHRVLAPGGLLLLSTPQGGATPGTPWDRHILTQPQLAALLKPERWDVEWFYQERYGWAEVKPGLPPSDAEIQIVKATRR